MRVIVFGGSGFVGSHVADALTTSGHDVTIFDRVESPHRQNGHRFVAGDILDSAAVRDAMADHEIVFSFAGQSDIDEARASPFDTMQQNILGCMNQLNAAVEAGSVERIQGHRGATGHRGELLHRAPRS